MEQDENIFEEEEMISENLDGNIMELVKTESAEMNIQIYVLSVVSLGYKLVIPEATIIHVLFSCDGSVCCLFSLQK